MGDLRFSPEQVLPDQLSFGTVADYVSGLTADPSDAPRPSLSELFTSKGVDAGLQYHDNTVSVYAEANPWTLSDTIAPADGMDGEMRTRNGELSFGATVDANGDVNGYAQGQYSVTFGNAGWTEPNTESYELDVYDDEGNIIGTETFTDEFEGFHSFDGPTTTLSVLGYADTSGDYMFAGTAAHDRTLSISDIDFGFHGEGTIGISDDFGGFAHAQAEMTTILHGDTGTYGYLEGEILIAQHSEHNYQSIEMGVETSALSNIGNGALGFIPPVRAGVMYDGEDVSPTIGMGISF